MFNSYGKLAYVRGLECSKATDVFTTYIQCCEIYRLSSISLADWRCFVSFRRFYVQVIIRFLSVPINGSYTEIKFAYKCCVKLELL